MTQYTFNPIRPADFNDSRRGMAQAGDSFNNGIEALKEVIRGQQGIQKQNYQQGITNNDAAIQANLEKLSSLGALRDADMTIGSLEGQYGKQYTQGAIKSLVDARRGVLQGKAFGTASGVGTETANTSFDRTKGSQAVYDNLLQQGATPEWAMAKSAEWEKNAGVLQNRYNQIKTDNTEKLYSEYGNVPVKSNDEIALRLAAGREKYKDIGGFDENAARELWSSGLKGSQADHSYDQQLVQEGRNTKTYNQGQEGLANKKAVTSALNQYQQTIANGGNPDSSRVGLANGLTGEVKQQFLAMAPEVEDASSRLSETDTLNYNNEKTASDARIQDFSSKGAAMVAALQKERANLGKILSDETMNEVNNYADPNGSAAGIIKGELGNGIRAGIGPNVLGGSSGAGHIEGLVQGLVEEGIEPKIANAMVITAYRMSGEKNTAFTGGKGVNPTAIGESLDSIKSRYASAIVKDKEIATTSAKHALALRLMTNQETDKLNTYQSGLRRENQTGNSAGSVDRNARTISDASIAAEKNSKPITGVYIPEGSLGADNNNTGNLKFANQPGAFKGKGGFAEFKSPEAGQDALERQVALDASRGATIESYLMKASPPSENNTKKLIKDVSGDMGLPAKTPLNGLNQREFAAVIAKWETGTKIAFGTSEADISAAEAKKVLADKIKAEADANGIKSSPTATTADHKPVIDDRTRIVQDAIQKAADKQKAEDEHIKSLRLSEDGRSLWAVKDGKTSRFMVEPEKIINKSIVKDRGGQTLNPKYTEWLRLKSLLNRG